MTTTVRHGYGPTRKTRKSAEREAAAWEASGDGRTYTYQAMHGNPAYTQTVTAEAVPVEGGYACRYTTTTTEETTR